MPFSEAKKKDPVLFSGKHGRWQELRQIAKAHFITWYSSLKPLVVSFPADKLSLFNHWAIMTLLLYTHMESKIGYFSCAFLYPLKEKIVSKTNQKFLEFLGWRLFSALGWLKYPSIRSWFLYEKSVVCFGKYYPPLPHS